MNNNYEEMSVMKKVARSLVVVLFLVFAFNTVAYAAVNDSKTTGSYDLQILAVKVQIGDAMIYAAIERAQFRASLPGANIDKIIKDLVAFSERVTSRLNRQAEKIGVTLIPEYITVDIGGHEVTIDPQRVPGV